MRAIKWAGRAIASGIICYCLLVASFFALVWGLPRLKMRADSKTA